MKAGTRQDQFDVRGFWIAVCGFLIRLFTHWLTPIHELMHGVPIVLLGGRITALRQTQIWYILPNMAFQPVVAVLGFWLEMFLYWSIAMRWPRRYANKAAAGIMPAVALYGLRSQDFNQLQTVYPANMVLYALVGLLLGVILLHRHLADGRVPDGSPPASPVRRARR